MFVHLTWSKLCHSMFRNVFNFPTSTRTLIFKAVQVWPSPSFLRLAGFFPLLLHEGHQCLCMPFPPSYQEPFSLQDPPQIPYLSRSTLPDNCPVDAILLLKTAADKLCHLPNNYLFHIISHFFDIYSFISATTLQSLEDQGSVLS